MSPESRWQLETHEGRHRRSGVASAAHLKKLRSTEGLVGLRVAHPTAYYRQYVGITVGKRRLIYVNAFPDDKLPSDWRAKLVNYCDGANAFWGVLYDPTTREFSELNTNGRA